MFTSTTAAEAQAIVAAMAAIATMDGRQAMTPADRASLIAAHRYLLRQEGPLDPTRLPAMSPEALGAALAERNVAILAARLITIMAFVDGTLDGKKVEAVERYGAALHIDEPYLKEIAEAAHGQIRLALADMTRRNMESITGKPWLTDDVIDWLLPYKGAQADPVLAKRYQALGGLKPDSFGHAYFDHYARNSYPFPGEPNALNEAFATPHDSTHVLSGYDTSPRGELLVSTFTSAMHPFRPMEGHVLPVIFSWHLGIKINDVAGSATGALEPTLFWEAWARGSAINTDVFAKGWDFWAATTRDLAALRQAYGVPPKAQPRPI